MAGKNAKQAEFLLVVALAKGATVAQAAQQARVSERTVYRRLQNPDFQKRIEVQQDETLQRAAAVLTAAAQEAIHSLVTLQDPSTAASVRRAAARDIIDMGLRLREAADFERRLVALENRKGSSQETSIPSESTSPRRPARRRRGDTALQIALASGATVVQAANKAGLSERTVYRRLNDATFHQRVDALRAEMVQRTAARLIASTLLAVKTLIDLQAPTMPASVRRCAAHDIIEMSQKLREATILEKRLAALETPAPPSPTSW